MDILLVEDNESIINGLAYAFQKQNYQLISKTTFSASLEYLYEFTPDLIILDVTLPDGNGFDLFKTIINKKEIPTIFLTAIDDENDIVNALNLGAEDYMTKPFSTKELIARMNRVLMRKNKTSIKKVKDIQFDLDKMIVYKDNKIVELSSLEIKILHLLFINVGKAVRRSAILDYIWEWTGNDVDDHTITVYMKRIREKLDSDIIVTIKGIGYRIDEE